MTKTQLFTCLVVLLSAVGAGVVPHAVDATPTEDAASVDAAVAQTAAPTLVTVRTELNETQPEVGSNFTLTTHVENVDDGDGNVFVESVEIRRTPDGDDVVAEEKPKKRLWSGDSLQNRQSLELGETGEHTLYVRVEFRHGNGESYEVVQPVDVTVFDPHPLMAVEAESTLPGSRTTLNVSLTNGVREPIRNVELQVQSDGVSVKDNRRNVAQLSGTATETFSFEVSGETSETVNLTADLEYTTANGTQRSVTRTLTPTLTELSNPGAVNLTGISVSRRGQTLQVTGSASNVGTTDVLSVVVGVQSNSNVSPGQSTAEYFVGEIPSSDFSSFKVQANLDSNASSVTIPLRVSYIVDDVRRVRTVSLTYDVPRTAPTKSSTRTRRFR
ncbi:hypothetical protein [Halorussus sp. MSC15.2]|uniref:hypothetical protein n=1 Tax=Halorussus sp. MSC15.2 TaxID=2283638 RepID=UPI0013D508C1|nr:hypothetical protein [Halorussus sp. MSC15.2]NEU58817.1 hypothetical protein [Halorussus sp. MSC15.2]